MKEKKEFSGLLAEPIVYVGQEPIALFIEIWNKLELLFEHYGIEERPDYPQYKWARLVLDMARDLVPGFKVLDHPARPARRGQPKRPMFEDIELLTEVWRLKEKTPGLTTSAAVKILVSNRKIGNRKSRWYGKNKRTLEKVVGEARRSREIGDFFDRVEAKDQTAMPEVSVFLDRIRAKDQTAPSRKLEE